MRKLGSAVIGDTARGLIVYLISAVIVVPLFCVCVCIPLGLATQPDVDSTTALLVMVIPMSLFLLIILGGGLVAVVWTTWRRARQLDAAFNPLGLAGSLYMLAGRQYHGTGEGREVDAYFYRGPTLILQVSTPLRTHLTVSEKAAVSGTLARAFDYQPLELTDPGLQDLSITALDEDWARALLANPTVQAVLQRLVTSEGWALLRQVHLQPGTLYLRLYRNRNLFRYEITPDQARQWLDDLLTLLRIAESLPAPLVTTELTSAERLAQSTRSTRGFLTVSIIVVLLVVVLPLCVLLPFLFLFLLVDAQ